MYQHDCVCTKCRTAYTPFIIGVLVIEMAGFGPYQVWGADLYRCPGCGATIVTAFSNSPIAHHNAPDFTDWLKQAKAAAPMVVYQYERPNRITGPVIIKEE